jgi:hypothetical protein
MTFWRVYEVLSCWQVAHPYPPTLRELAQALGLRSFGSLWAYLDVGVPGPAAGSGVGDVGRGEESDVKGGGLVWHLPESGVLGLKNISNAGTQPKRPGG